MEKDSHPNFTDEEWEDLLASIDAVVKESKEAPQYVPQRQRDLNWNEFRGDYKYYSKDELVAKYPQLKLNPRMNKIDMVSAIYQYKLYKPTKGNKINQLFEGNPDPQVNKLIDKVINDYVIQRKEEEIIQAKLLADQRFQQAVDAGEVNMTDFHLKRIDFTKEFNSEFMKEGDEDTSNQLAENFEKLYKNTPKSARILVKLFTTDEKEIYMELNEEQVDWLVNVIKNGGEFFENPKEYEGYSEGSSLAGIKIIDIDQLPMEKQLRAHRALHAGFPYVHKVDHSPYTKYQIYGYKDVRDDENCFVHTLKVSGLVPEDKIASISARVGMLPYIGYKGVDFIAEEFKLNIRITVLRRDANGKAHRKYKSFEYGSEDDPVIFIGSFNKHFVLNEEISPNKDTLKVISDLFRLDQVKPILNKDIQKQAPELIFEWTDNDLRKYQTESKHFMSRFLSTIKDLYQVGGNLEVIIRKCLRGGRCLISQKKLHVYDSLVDLDVNALYPYAMTKLFIQCGKPKKMPAFWTLDYVLQNADEMISQAFMEIEITKIGKRRQYPVINGLHEDYYWVDLITLQDLIKYHEIEATLVRGIYYDGPRDYSIQRFIRCLHDKRRILEITDREDEAKELKLAMNKIYGYACQRNHPMKFKEMSKEEVEDYMIANFGIAPIAKPDNENEGIYHAQTAKEWTNSFNMCNLAVSICSMARRIMNEILYTCEDNNIEVFYSDTDSIFIRERDMDKLNALFLNELIGDELGQMSSDIKNKDFYYAEEAIFLAKKQYCLKLDDTHYQVRRAFISDEKLGDDVWKFFRQSCGEL